MEIALGNCAGREAVKALSNVPEMRQDSTARERGGS